MCVLICILQGFWSITAQDQRLLGGSEIDLFLGSFRRTRLHLPVEELRPTGSFWGAFGVPTCAHFRPYFELV